MDKRLITRNFSRHADLYDQFAQVQKRSAEDLANEFALTSSRSILEIGCGTGLYTHILRQSFPNAKILAVDIAEPMVHLARQNCPDKNISFAVADADHLPTADRFDLVTSAACFQWIGNLDRTLSICSDHLTSKNLLTFSIFGPKTYCELDATLSSIDPASRVEASRFPSLEEIRKILSQRFDSIQIVERLYHQTFADVKSLLTTIKYCGVRGRGSIRFGPQLIEKLDKKYRETFGEIRATSQVFLCKGQKT
jgi:malonyl-CoA O-methyltransferase